MATASGGFANNGLTLATIATVNGDSVVNCDTQYPNGAGPQSLAVPLKLLGMFMPVNLGVTAHAGGGQANATLLGYGLNTVTVVATAADSVKLPPSYPGAIVIIDNQDSADATTVYGSGIDTVNGVATGTGVSLAHAKACIYIASATGTSTAAANWTTILTA